MTTPPGQRVFLAILLFLLALLLFNLMGLVVKYLAPRFFAAELSAYRNLFGLLPAAIALWSTPSWHRGGRVMQMRQWRLAVLRGAIVIFAQFMFYLALARLAFATATTISYSNALFMVAFAVPLLGEKVGWVRWAAVLVGLVGVVMVIGVGRDAFSWDALLPVAAAALYALTGITARMIDDDVPTPLMNLYSSASAAVGAGLFVFIVGGYSPIQSWGDLAWIVAMGACGGSAVLAMVISFRMTEQSNLAPISYFGIPMAFVLGWVIYGETPWADLFPGVVLIILGGLMIVWREQRLQRAAS